MPPPTGNDSTSSTISESVALQNEYRKRIENDQEMLIIGSIEETEMYKLMRSLEDFLDDELGNTWWSFYVAAAFWSNISTPLNLCITLLSAITAGQAATGTGGGSFLSPSMFTKVSVASLLLSTLNTFFRPQNKYMEIMQIMKGLNDIAFEFEGVYYTRNLITRDFKRRYEAYKVLKMKYNKFINEITPEQQSFVTDFLFFMVKQCCLKKGGTWLELTKDEKESLHMDYLTREKKLKQMQEGRGGGEIMEEPDVENGFHRPPTPTQLGFMRTRQENGGEHLPPPILRPRAAPIPVGESSTPSSGHTFYSTHEEEENES